MIAKNVCLALLLAAVACSSSGKLQPPTSVPSAMTIDQLQSRLGHRLARPGPELGAELLQTGLLNKSGDTFEGRSAATSYTWRGYVAILRQGSPVEGFTLRKKVNRDDAIFETRADGSEVVFLPPAGPAGASPTPTAVIASALILSARGWLVQVSMSGNATTGAVTTATLKTFVAGIVF